MIKNCVVIVQARATSSRLPGKVLKLLDGKPVLWHVLQRCRLVDGVDEVWCAIPLGMEHDLVAKVAKNAGANIYRGAENDVLSRYLGAALAARASHIIRVTSDCPVISPDICENLIRLIETTKSDYCSNNMPRTWPHGLDCEIFSFDALELAAKNAKADFEREHVTPWIRSYHKFKRTNLSSQSSWDLSIRLTLDYPDDLLFFQELFNSIVVSPYTRLDQIMDFLAQNPKIADINRLCARA